MNVWLLKTGERLPLGPDVRRMRTGFLAEKLCGRGHKVTWWADAFDHFSKEWVFKEDTEYGAGDSLSIVALKGLGYRRNYSLRRYLDYKAVAGKFGKMAVYRPKPDIIVASMPSYDLAYEALRYGIRNGVPVLTDIRDQWPDIFIDYVPQALRWAARAALFNDYRKVRRLMAASDGLIAATDGFLGWGLKYSGREKRWTDKVFYLGYGRDGETDEPGRISSVMDRLEGKFVATFIGTFGMTHNPVVLVDCAKRLQGTDIMIVLAGDGPVMEDIRRRADGLPNLLLTGWLNRREAEALLRRSHVGVCASPRDIALFPNKAFMYLSAGLPVISNFGGDLRALAQKHRFGMYAPPGDAGAMADCITKMKSDNNLYKDMAECAKRFFDSHGNADVIYEEYARHIENVKAHF